MLIIWPKLISTGASMPVTSDVLIIEHLDVLRFFIGFGPHLPM